MLLKNFEQFIGQRLNEGDDVYQPTYYIPQETIYWQKMVDLFATESGGKKLTNYAWVFENNDINGSIMPPSYIICLFNESKTFGIKRYGEFIKWLQTQIQEDFEYYRKQIHDSTYVAAGGANMLTVARNLYTLWIDNFYVPIRDAAKTGDVSKISLNGMKYFEERITWETGVTGTDATDQEWEDIFFEKIRNAVRFGRQGTDLGRQIDLTIDFGDIDLNTMGAYWDYNSTNEIPYKKGQRIKAYKVVGVSGEKILGLGEITNVVMPTQTTDGSFTVLFDNGDEFTYGIKLNKSEAPKPKSVNQGPPAGTASSSGGSKKWKRKTTTFK